MCTCALPVWHLLVSLGNDPSFLQFIEYMDVISVPVLLVIRGSVSQRKMAEDVESDLDISKRKQVIQAQMGKTMVKGQTW
jgi:hypothetical protein